MSNEIKSAIGVDCGTSYLVSAIMAKNEEKKDIPEFQLQRNAFYKADEGDLTRNVLNESGVSYIEDKKNKALYIVGEDAVEFAQNMGGELSRPMSKGAISSKEQAAIPIIKQIIKSILIEQLPSDEDVIKINNGEIKKRKLIYSVPAPAIDDPAIDIKYHSRILTEIFSSLGFDPTPMNEAHAIIYAEMAKEKYTGMAISFGAGMMNVSVSKSGMTNNSLTFSISKSGDWIDESSARAANTETIVAQTIKEADDFDLSKNYESGTEKAIQTYYKILISDILIPALEERFSKATFNQDINIVLSGGTVKVKGFLSMCKTMFPDEFKNKMGLTIKICGIRMGSNVLLSVAKGCMFKAVVG